MPTSQRSRPSVDAGLIVTRRAWETRCQSWRQRERRRQLDDDARTFLLVSAPGAERRSEPRLVVASRLVRERGAQMHLATARERGEWPARRLERVVLARVAVDAAHAVHRAEGARHGLLDESQHRRDVVLERHAEARQRGRRRGGSADVGRLGSRRRRLARAAGQQEHSARPVPRTVANPRTRTPDSDATPSPEDRGCPNAMPRGRHARVRDPRGSPGEPMTVDPRAGKPPEPSMLANIPRLVSAYYTQHPDPSRREERVAFGTSGHRGSSLNARVHRVAHPRHHAGDLSVPARAEHRRSALPRHRHARALGVGVRQRARGARGQRRRRHDRFARRLHADARALARHPRVQPRPHRPDSPTASS